jgi:uncharacterized protein
MSLNKLLIIFGIILVVIAGVVFFQFRSNNGSSNSSEDSPSSTVTINEQTFNVEVADTPESQQTGLSNRESLPEDQGLLFVFETKGFHTFWMKNMAFPIDIIFINDETVVSVVKNAEVPESPDAELQLYRPTEPINKVLEINAGLADEYDIKEGDKVEIKI